MIAALILQPSRLFEGPHANARGVRAIGILDCPITCFQTGCVEGLLDVCPGPGLTTPYWHRSVGSMKIIPNVEIVLRLSKVRQYLVIRPFIVCP